MSVRLVPEDGVNPYAEHPGFDAPECQLRYTVTQGGPWGGIKGGFGCEMTGRHCLPAAYCEKRRADAAQQDQMKAMFEIARTNTKTKEKPA